MLRFLGVRNLAIIDRLDVEFEPGLNVLTGETGAGKSMLVEAIDLLVGGRASADLVRTGENLATVQAIFERPDGREVIVRREISAQGRSRAFIDDALATTAALKELGARLLDLHGQHEHQALLDPAEHVTLLDAFAGQPAEVEQVRARFDDWRAAAAARDRTGLDDREKRARIEMATFHLQEIDRVAPHDGEDAALETERRVLANADRLSRWSSEAYAALYEGERAALPSLAGVWKRVADLAALDERFARYVDQRDEVKVRLEDLAFFLRDYAADLDASPDRLQRVEDRLAALERLKRKFGSTLADVLIRRQELQTELAALDASDERAAALAARADSAAAAFLEAAKARSARRTDAAPALAHGLQRILGDLAMPDARVDVRLTPGTGPDDWTATGVDGVEFFLSPNPGEELRPLARIASGGELSRIMLALRTLANRDEPGRTLVFDEVDVGIGGAAADAVGARLQMLGRNYQVLVITHLPAIASRATTHFEVVKQVREGRTTTEIRRLDPGSRELEVARMIAGAQISDGVRASARELLLIREDEQTAKDRSGKRGRRRDA